MAAKIRNNDLDLSFRLHPLKNELVAKKGQNAINQSVLNLLYRDRRGVAFEPEKEVNIKDLLFEPMSSGVAAALENRIKMVLHQYEPRVEILFLQTIPYMNENRYQIVLQYRIVDTGEEGRLNHFFQRIG